MGVYFPYMIVDANAHAFFKGRGEHETRRYTKKVSEDRIETYYDADVYEIEREFDIIIEGLTIESSSERLDKYASNKTNNVINAIMPFDIENSVKYNANYLKGYTSEKRDVNIDDLRLKVDNQLEDIARFTANKTITFYDRGVCWDKEDFIARGKQWKSAYLPVWLYSYQEIKKGNNKVLHYVAVNARTREVMGSIPIQMGKLLCVSAFVELFGWLITLIIEWKYELAFLLTGIGYFAIMYMRYRNKNARHAHETETKSQMSAFRKVDKLINRKTRLTKSRMANSNNTRLKG